MLVRWGRKCFTASLTESQSTTYDTAADDDTSARRGCKAVNPNLSLTYWFISEHMQRQRSSPYYVYSPTVGIHRMEPLVMRRNS